MSEAGATTTPTVATTTNPRKAPPMGTSTTVAPDACVALDLRHLDLTPEQTARTLGRGLFGAFERQLRADGGTRPDFPEQLARTRRLAHAEVDATLDELARQVDAGWWGLPLGRRLRAVVR